MQQRWLREKLRPLLASRWARLALRKSTILRMIGEGYGGLAKRLSMYVERYRRGRRILRPKSFEHFLESDRYDGFCEAVFYAPRELLKEEGLLEPVERGGYKYWSFLGTLLRPRRYMGLYSEEPFLRTLLRDLGLEDLVEELEIGEISVDEDSLSMKIGDFTVTVYGDRTRVSLRRGDLRAVLHLDGVGAETVRRGMRWVEDYGYFFAEEVAENLASTARALGFSPDHVSVDVYADDYRVSYVSGRLRAEATRGQLSTSLILTYRFDRAGAVQPGGLLEIEVEHSYASRHLAQHFGYTIMGFVEEMRPPMGWVSTHASAGHSVHVSFTVRGPPQVQASRWAALAGKGDALIVSLVERAVEGVKDISGEGRALLRRLLHAPDRSLLPVCLVIGVSGDEVLVRNYQRIVIPVRGYAKAILDVRGAADKELYAAINDPMGTIARLVMGGRLTVRSGRVFLDGQDLSRLAGVKLSSAATDYLASIVELFEAARNGRARVPVAAGR